MYQPPICKNDRCSKLVPPGKNPGKPRLFCEPACARRYHARAYYQRGQGKAGAGLIFVNELGQAQVNRRIALTAKAADQRWKMHLALCEFSGGRCTAISDPYGRKRLCLIAAVLGDDWTQLKDVEEGKPVKRHSTTQDGRWLADLSEAEKTGVEKKVEALLSPEVKAAAIAAGAWRGEEQQDEALARYNEGLPLSQ
jgi:hypothetical protein